MISIKKVKTIFSSITVLKGSWIKGIILIMAFFNVVKTSFISFQLKKRAVVTWTSQAVPHLSTNHA